MKCRGVETMGSRATGLSRKPPEGRYAIDDGTENRRT